MALRLLGRSFARPVRPTLLAGRFAVAGSHQVARIHSARALFQATDAKAAAAADAGASKADPFSDVKILGSSAGGSRPSSHWSLERLLSMSLVPSFALGIFFDHVLIDLAIVAALVPHCHLGMNQVLLDYIHPRKFPVLGPAVNGVLVIATSIVACALFKMAVFDDGVTKTVKKLLHA